MRAAWLWLNRNGWLVQAGLWTAACAARMLGGRSVESIESAMAMSLLLLILHRQRK